MLTGLEIWLAGHFLFACRQSPVLFIAVDCHVRSPAAHEWMSKYSSTSAALFDTIHADVLAAPHASVPSPAAAQSGQLQTTVGLMVKNQVIENLLIGGPAMISRQLERGDVILKVDGREVSKVIRCSLRARILQHY